MIERKLIRIVTATGAAWWLAGTMRACPTFRDRSKVSQAALRGSA